MRQSLKMTPLHFIIITLPLMLLIEGCNKASGSKPDLQLNTRLDSIRQAGFPVTLPELNDWYAQPPDAENAAPLYADAFASLSGLAPNAPDFLPRKTRVLDLLHQAASRPKCRFDLDLTQGAKAALPHLPQLRKAAQLLADEANAQAANGKMDLAARSLLDGLHLVRSIEEEPLLLSRLLQIASVNLMQTSLESILNRKKFSEEQLAALQAGFGEAEKGLSLTRPVAGERAMGIALFQLPPAEGVQVLAKLQKPAVVTDFEAYWKTSTFGSDFNAYLELMDKAISASALPYPQCLEEIAQWTTQAHEIKKKAYLVSDMLLPAMEAAFDRAAECAARTRVAQAALAVERYRLAHVNALPDSLGQLVPQFLAQIPSDPFDGQPLRYEKLPSSGLVVYSIGKDRQDDRGVPRPPGANGDTAYDITFLVKR